jgi:cyclic beta-1,2-glucan synthetase
VKRRAAEISAAPLAAAVSSARERSGAAGGAWLSNGLYRTLMTARGGGCSAFGPIALTRWRADALADGDGLALFVRDLESGNFGPARGGRGVDTSGWTESRREPGRVVMMRSIAGIEVRLEIAVAPDAACELRRLELHNRSDRARRVDVTSFCEVALLPQAADLAHPAFSRLFVETEFVPEAGALLAKRRARTADEAWPVLVHALYGSGTLEHESDRVRFIGRSFDPARPRALEERQALSGTTGAVLDPALSLRRTVKLEAGGSCTLTALLGVGPDRGAAIELARRFDSPTRVQEAFELAADAEAARWREFGLDSGEAAELDALAAALLCGPVRSHPVAELERDLRDAGERLAALGLAPNAVRVVADERRASPEGGALRTLERAARYWRALGLEIESCAITRTRVPGESQSPDVRLFDLGSLEPDDTETLLRTASLVITEGGWPARADLPESASTEARFAAGPASGGRAAEPKRTGAAPKSEALQFFNGYGGFNGAGDEYVIRMAADASGRLGLPPRPWVNVIANERFGFLFSETGAGCTWSVNSREHRITPWVNDPLIDPHDAALYLRDDETGESWSPLPGPAPAAADYEVRHGFGYSVCRVTCSELEQEVWNYVPTHDPVKITRLRVRNLGARARQLSCFAMQSLVLGELRSRSARAIETWSDPGNEAVMARHRAGGEFAGRVAFASVRVEGTEARTFLSGDRASFLGEGGDARRPRALTLETLDGGFGIDRDPAFAEQARFDLAPGAEAEIVLLLGEGEHRDDAAALLERYRSPLVAGEALAQVRRFWTRLLGAIRIETPVAALDLMVNGWLLYQTISCRLWGRTALYQSGGAFGFRDQLQDSLALIPVRPDWTRAQLLLHASHQFMEGDVLHWWHPPGDCGLRTRVVDDRLWLPYGVARYVRATGDAAVLNEMAPYLRGPVLEADHDQAFLRPEPAQHFRDLYEHCCHAIDCSLSTGAHQLPLFGTGDWNDGMNAVGREGRGESVWMGFFLYRVLGDFLPLCRLRGDHGRAGRYQEQREQLAAALEREAWDGEWYRRGWYDDGTPLGSSASDECQIDALAQAWAALSGAVSRERVERALESLERRLVLPAARLVRLLAPPFDRTPHSPGYIKGYVPGVRENGGQYTHAAIWVARALAESGHADRAAERLEWISPVGRSSTRADADVYQVEPYVLAADVYAEPPHVGLGGWTWYTGSSGWMHRTVIESLLGISVDQGCALAIEPRWPSRWRQCRVWFSPPGTRATFEISMRQSGGAETSLVSASLDGAPLPVVGGRVHVPFPQDAAKHEVALVFGLPVQDLGSAAGDGGA